MLTEERLADVLAAIGNHEAKALLFLAMQPDVGYGTTALHRLHLAIQGQPPAWTGQVTMQQKYCMHSFEPIGLVARQRNEGGFIRHVKADPDGTAAALAGFLLALSESHPVALAQIFGKTSINHMKGSERSPIRRYRVLRVLATTPSGEDPPHTVEIARRARVPGMPVAAALTAFSLGGLLEYTSGATYEMKTVYRVTAPMPVPIGRGNVATRQAIVGFLNARFAAAGHPFEVAREEIEAHLRSLPRWADAPSIRDHIQKVMKSLVDRGLVDVVRAHYSPNHSAVAIGPAGRAYVTRLVDGIAAIAAGDEPALAAGRRQREELVADPARVRPLVAKAYAASKQASNPVTDAEKDRRVLAALAARPGMTSAELLDVLGPALDKDLLGNALAMLRRGGSVRGEKQPDGPYKRWFVIDEAAR